MRRISTQRETFARFIEASQFDWRPRQWSDDQDTLYNLHDAPLENGHELQAHSWKDKPELGWTWYLHTPGQHKDSWHDDNWPASGGTGSAHVGVSPHHHNNFIPTEQEAKSQAEAKYKELFPIGTNTGTHDSGIDYSDLNSFKDHL